MARSGGTTTAAVAVTSTASRGMRTSKRGPERSAFVRTQRSAVTATGTRPGIIARITRAVSPRRAARASMFSRMSFDRWDF